MRLNRGIARVHTIEQQRPVELEDDLQLDDFEVGEETLASQFNVRVQLPDAQQEDFTYDAILMQKLMSSRSSRKILKSESMRIMGQNASKADLASPGPE